ncbi:MAG: nitroreductase family protein [Deltaproteobacteria bacterium]|nr:nitroreductase family protein [Deltaproteobacteria bacterium]
MNETIKTIHHLRTIHGDFSSREIDDEALKVILDASVRAANASARQSYSIVVVRDRKIMQELCGYQGSRALIYCVDYNRIIDTAKHLKHSFEVSGIVPFVTGTTDTILAAQTAAIAARSMGIDLMFTNGIHRGDINRVYDILELPKKYCFPLIALILGYPNQEPDHQKGRLNGPGVVHYEKYRKATKEDLYELVAQYDDLEKHMGLDNTWRKQGLDHYLDWFYTIWSTRGGPPEGRSQMAEILEQMGFME